MSSTASHTLDAHNVHVAFGGVHALSGVDLKVHYGKILGLIGPNGAGKTTIVNVLSGFQKPTKGHVVLNGKDVSKAGPHQLAKAGIGRSFQAARLFKDMTVEANLMVAAIGAGLGKAEAAEHALDVLSWMNLAHLAPVRGDALAYSDERRISIARALALHPTFLLLDEPASGMNDTECDALMAMIREIPGRFGCGVLLIEHNMKVIMGLCEHIHVLDGGRSLAEGTPSDVQNDPNVRRAYLGERTEPATA